jgi:hypothetical protein
MIISTGTIFHKLGLHFILQIYEMLSLWTLFPAQTLVDKQVKFQILSYKLGLGKSLTGLLLKKFKKPWAWACPNFFQPLLPQVTKKLYHIMLFIIISSNIQKCCSSCPFFHSYNPKGVYTPDPPLFVLKFAFNHPFKFGNI